MTVSKEYVLHCDYCLNWVRCGAYNSGTKKFWPEPTLAAARKWARKRGWTFIKVGSITRDRCQQHGPIQ